MLAIRTGVNVGLRTGVIGPGAKDWFAVVECLRALTECSHSAYGILKRINLPAAGYCIGCNYTHCISTDVVIGIVAAIGMVSDNDKVTIAISGIESIHDDIEETGLLLLGRLSPNSIRLGCEAKRDRGALLGSHVQTAAALP